MKRRILATALAFSMLISGAGSSAVIEAKEPEKSDSLQKMEIDETVSERSVEFNKDWSFNLGDVSGAEKLDFDDSSWRKLTLPHDWSIEQDFTTAVSSEVGHLPGGTGWYRKSFTLPESMKGKRFRIDFGGVYMDSTTYVNGVQMGNYPYGYSPFSYDITDELVFDGETENVIAVKVVNSTVPGQQTSRWYSGSGIYRDVYLTITEPVHVGVYGNVITTPDIEQEYASGNVTVHAKTTVENESDADTEITVKNTILNYEDDSVFTEAVSSESYDVKAGEEVNVEMNIKAQSPALWSVDEPNLYKMRTEILVDGEVTDTYDSRFGFRWVEFDKDEGFSLNGEYMKLQGVCMHHDQGALGSAAYEAATARQMRIMKEMGANAIRVTHNPASDVLLKQCDEQGLLVIDEAFDTWYYGKNANDYGRFFEKEATHPDAEEGITWGQYDLQQMIRRGINFPSIIMWSLGNEVFQSREEKGVETARKLVEWAKEIDTTRGVTMGEDKLRDNSAPNSVGAPYVQIAEMMDVVGFNYGEKNYDGYREMYPDWIVYGSETASSLKSRGYYSDPHKTTDAQDVVEYQVSSYDNRAVPWGATGTHSLIPDRDRKWVLGQFVWTGFDYIGEPTPYAFSQTSIPKSSYFGIVDTAGFAKDDYYLYQSQWLDVETDPMVHIFPHWNWEDKTLRDKVTVDGKIPVRVYSNAPRVEMFLNGDSLGEKSFAQMTTEDGRTYQQQSEESDRLYLEWQIPYEYQPGAELVAVAKDAEGKEIARDKVATAGNASKLNTYADRQVIKADGKDLAYITVDVTDASGNFMPTAMNQLYFNITGNGKIVGVDNGDASSWERYKDTDGVWKRKAFNGKALVIVQSTEEAGSFTVTATGSGVEASSVTVYTKGADTVGDEILGYETPEVTVSVGEEAVFPEKIHAYRADGTTEEIDVEWEQPGELNKPAELLIKGLTSTDVEVMLKLHVRGLVGIRDTTLVTGIGQMPTFPTEVKAIWSDGMIENRNVEWEVVEEEKLNESGLFEVKGSVEGTDFEAVAKIHVKEATDEINIALAEKGTTVEATYQEGVDKHPYKEINDGIINTTNGYGNWAQQNRREDSVTFTFQEAQQIEHVTAWLISLNTWQTPDRITIEYWDGENFVPVENQSKTTGFGSLSNPSQEYEGEQITFDLVETEKIRVTFAVNGYGAGKDMMKISEFQIWGKGIAPSDESELLSLQVDGKDIEGFAADKYLYTLEVPYGSKIPEVTAKASDFASVFVRQALSLNSSAQIQVVSESGKNVANYMVQLIELPPALAEVTLLAKTTDITEDDFVELNVAGKLQDGSNVNVQDVTVTYTIKDLTGHAELQSGKLAAFDEGQVEVTAHMTYKGKTVDSNTLTFNIAKNTKPKELLSYEEITVETKKGVEPVLPEMVTARFEYGPNRKLPVVWEKIPEEKLMAYGTFTMEGVVEGYEKKAKLTVLVRDVLKVQEIAAAVPKGQVPELPGTVDVYFTDGTSENFPVTWGEMREADFTVDAGNIVTVAGKVVAKEKDMETVARVRVVDGQESPNYVAQRNGYRLPLGIASYTNDNAISDTGYDRAGYMNDGEKSFAMVTGKKIWSNWLEGSTQREGDWVSAVIAYEGKLVERYVDRVSIGICQESNEWQQIRLPAEYYVEYYTGPLDYEVPEQNGQVERWENHPVNTAENWKEVTYINKPDVSTLDGQRMTDITFQPVKTNLVRVRMKAQPGKCLGVNEIEVYGKQASANTEYTVEEILLDGTNVLEQFNEDLEMKYAVTDKMPEVVVKAKNNPWVTIIPATEENQMIQIVLRSENGSELGETIYTIHLTKEEIPEDLEEAIQAAKEAAKKAETAKEAAEAALNHAQTQAAEAEAKAKEAKAEAEKATERAENAKAKAEAAEAAQAAAEEAARQAEENAGDTAEDREAAEAAKMAAEAAKEATKEAKAEADTAAKEAEEAKTAAETAQIRAEAAQTKAETAQIKAEEAKEAAEEAAKAAEQSESNALEAKEAAERAKAKAENAQKEAEAAADAAGEANKEAGTARDAAQAAAEKAEIAKKLAEAQAEVAMKAADESKAYAEMAEAARKAAEEAAKRAEEARKEAEEELKRVKEEAEKKLEEMRKLLEETVKSTLLSCSDFKEGSWYEDYVTDVYLRGYMTGMNSDYFGINETLVRAQFAVILYRMAGEPEVEFKENFADVKDGQFYSDAVTWASEQGIITGYEDSGLFGPNDSITREQMATIMYRYADVETQDEDTDESLKSFPDAEKVSEFAKEALTWCVEEGIITGKTVGDEQILDAQGNTLRAECAAIISRFAAWKDAK